MVYSLFTGETLCHRKDGRGGDTMYGILRSLKYICIVIAYCGGVYLGAHGFSSFVGQPMGSNYGVFIMSVISGFLIGLFLAFIVNFLFNLIVPPHR